MSRKMIPYFSLVKNEEKKIADIIVFGDIVSKGLVWWDELFPADVNSYDLVAQLNDIPEDYEITVHINSNGGEVKEGLAIYNALKTRNVTTICEGFAASAASLVFMAGKRRVMNAASLLFIHQAIVSASGNPDELEKVANDLRTITEAAANAYKEGGVTCSEDELMRMLKAETWIKAEDALELGFATEIAEAEDDEEGVVTNDAMKSIIAAVTKKPSTLGQIGVDIDVAPLEKIVERLDETVGNLVAATEKLTPEPTPAGANKKGFFNLGGKR